MNRGYHRWYSPRLHRDMELLVFGHAGAKVLMFPTREGRFFEYETIGLVGSLAEKIEADHLQLFCIEGLAQESLYAFDRPPCERIGRQQALEDYILHEVMPLMQGLNGHACTMAAGCSLGAFQAASLVFRHPHLFAKLVALSGRFDLTAGVEHFADLFHGYYDETVYYHMPLHFLPGLGDWRLERLRGVDIVLAVGDQDPFLDSNLRLSRILSEKHVPHRLHFWQGRAHRAGAWRKMAGLYI